MQHCKKSVGLLQAGHVGLLGDYSCVEEASFALLSDTFHCLSVTTSLAGAERLLLRLCRKLLPPIL